MKRLMVMTGRAGKALLEINGDRSGAAVKYGGSCGCSTAREIPAGEEGLPSYRWGQWR